LILQSKELVPFLITWSEVEKEKEIGRGSFGVVYKGKYKSDLVAMKMLDESLQTEATEFISEAKVMSTIPTHANVVRLIGFCAKPPAILSEFVNGGSLHAYLQSPKVNISLLGGCRILRDIANGLAHLHENKIIHRDMAARNILLKNNSQLPIEEANPVDITALISDMGMSRLVETDQGKTATNIGPIKWMSPEALQSKVYSTKSDVWSFGIVCIEVFNRDLPFAEIDAVNVGVGIVNGTLTPEIPLITPVSLKDSLKSCWNIDPNQRPTASQLYQTLDEIVNND